MLNRKKEEQRKQKIEKVIAGGPVKMAKKTPRYKSYIIVLV